MLKISHGVLRVTALTGLCVGVAATGCGDGDSSLSPENGGEAGAAGEDGGGRTQGGSAGDGADAGSNAGGADAGGGAGETVGGAGQGGSIEEGGAGGDGGASEQGGTPEPGGTAGDGGAASGALCGDGAIEEAELCDDGNVADGDGCNASCESESGFLCTTDSPTECEPRCGDGMVVGAELEAGACDDGNTEPDDGCSASCSVETGWVCSDAPSECSETCGDGALDDREACDDGNTEPDDGCAACILEPGWLCDGEPSECVGVPDSNLLIDGDTLAALSSRDATVFEPAMPLTGLLRDEVLVSIDRRPQNGMLYGLAFDANEGTARLYVVSPLTGHCSPVDLFVSDVEGTQFGTDFNAVVDRLRVVTDAGQNFRINPNSGLRVDGDPNVVGLQPDSDITGETDTIHETAYTNNLPSATVTTQYTISQATDSLYIQNPPNAGVQTTPIPLGSPVSFVGGFDVPPGVSVGTANAISRGSGLSVLRFEGDSVDSLVRVSLTDGTLTEIGPVGTGTLGFARQNVAALPIMVLTAAGTGLLRFSSERPGDAVSVTVTGINAGETLVGIDWRPQTGQLYGLGIDAAADSGSLYVIDPSSGAVAFVSVLGMISLVDENGDVVDLPPVNGGYGFDFDPATDQIRVVTGTGLNFRVLPDDALPVDGDADLAGINPDGALNGLSPDSSGLSAIAHTNNTPSSPGSGVTTAYALEPDENGLYLLSPPNAGTGTSFVELTVGGSPLNFTSIGGFDISDDVHVEAANAPAEGAGYAALSVAGEDRLYRIDLATGEAVDLGLIGDSGVGGLAVGHVAVR